MGRRSSNPGSADRLRLNATILMLKAKRIDMGLTQADVAASMGTQQSTVSEMEALAVDPQVTTLLRYARAVGSSLRIDVGDR